MGHIDTQFFYFPEIGRMVPLFVARSAYVLLAVRWTVGVLFVVMTVAIEL